MMEMAYSSSCLESRFLKRVCSNYSIYELFGIFATKNIRNTL